MEVVANTFPDQGKAVVLRNVIFSNWSPHFRKVVDVGELIWEDETKLAHAVFNIVPNHPKATRKNYVYVRKRSESVRLSLSPKFVKICPESLPDLPGAGDVVWANFETM